VLIVDDGPTDRRQGRDSGASYPLAVSCPRRAGGPANVMTRAMLIPVVAHALALGGVGVWLVVKINDPAERGTWGLATATLAMTRLRSAVAVGVLATVIGVAVTAAAIGVLALWRHSG
jgi:hypothetical protein